MKSSPGPWRVAPDEPLIVETMDGKEIADCSMHNATMPSIANAQLIACAPELLEACIEALDWVLATEVREQLKKVITKATQDKSNAH